FISSRRRHTRSKRDWSSDVCSSDLVDNQYYGLVPKKELYDNYHVGDSVHARVVRVREDGKLDLSIREKAYLQMDEDGETILRVMDEYGGVLPFGEEAAPETIKKELHMSKNA